jgi:hypothetical protein
LLPSISPLGSEWEVDARRKPQMAGAAEHHARRIVQIMKETGTAAGEIMTFGAIEAVWLERDNADHKELLAGLKYAGDQGWVEDVGSAIRLTAEGAKSVIG